MTNKVVVALPYIGKRYYLALPASFKSTIEYKLWGAGGGGSNLGTSGAGGNFLSGTFNANYDSVIEVFVGGGGSHAGGGDTGYGGVSYNSSSIQLTGGYGGPFVDSDGGGGGGGGAASAIVVGGTIVAVAGGGGGGAGYGDDYTGNPNPAYGKPNSSNNSPRGGGGVAGQDDGNGGGGGGGAGYPYGGAGGSQLNGGYNGLNYNMVDNPYYTGSYASYTVPGGVSDIDYPGGGVGYGGGQGSGGASGYAILTFYNKTVMFTKREGEYKEILPSVRIAGAYRPITSWVKNNGVWNPVLTSGTISFSQDYTNWG